MDAELGITYNFHISWNILILLILSVNHLKTVKTTICLQLYKHMAGSLDPWATVSDPVLDHSLLKCLKMEKKQEASPLILGYFPVLELIVSILYITVWEILNRDIKLVWRAHDHGFMKDAYKIQSIHLYSPVKPKVFHRHWGGRNKGSTKSKDVFLTFYCQISSYRPPSLSL